MNAVIYARYSSHAQRDVSIDQQVEACERYAHSQDLTILRVYADRAMTGTNDKRPEFQRMIDDSKSREFAFVIVYALDRFARDRYDSAIYKRELKSNGVRVLSASENISDDPTGILIESLLEGYAEYYSRELSRKVVRGMLDNARKGMINGILPFGYARDGDKIVINEMEAQTVNEIFTRIAQGDALSEIMRDLNARGIRTKSGMEWNYSSFNRILSNRRYTGIYIHSGIEIPGGMPKIVDEEVFDRVQSVLKTKKRPRGRRRDDNAMYLLTGKLYCGLCGAPMVGVSGVSKTGDRHYYYKCRQRHADKSCSKSNVRREWLEAEVTEALKSTVLSDDVIAWMCEKAAEYVNADPPELETLKTRLAQDRKSIDNIISAIERGIMSESLSQRLSELEAEASDTERKIVEIKNRRGINPNQIEYWLKSFRAGSAEDERFKETLFDVFLSAVYLDEDGFKIVFNYAGDKKESYKNFLVTNCIAYTNSMFFKDGVFVFCVSFKNA